MTIAYKIRTLACWLQCYNSVFCLFFKTVDVVAYVHNVGFPLMQEANSSWYIIHDAFFISWRMLVTVMYSSKYGLMTTISEISEAIGSC